MATDHPRCSQCPDQQGEGGAAPFPQKPDQSASLCNSLRWQRLVSRQLAKLHMSQPWQSRTSPDSMLLAKQESKDTAESKEKSLPLRE